MDKLFLTQKLLIKEADVYRKEELIQILTEFPGNTVRMVTSDRGICLISESIAIPAHGQKNSQ